MLKRMGGLFLIAVFLMGCMVGGAASIQPPEGGQKVDVPLYDGAKNVSMAADDQAAMVAELLGRKALLYASTISVTKTEKMGDEIQSEWNEKLPKEKWRLKQDWVRIDRYWVSSWRNGDYELTAVILDGMTSEDVSDMQRMYGIEDVELGESLVLVLMQDTHQPLPDLTATAEAAGWSASATAQSDERAATATARAAEYEATQISKEAAQTATVVSATQSAQETQVSAAATAAVTPTATPDPYPPVALPFVDSFDQGVRPEWRILSKDQPAIVNGRLSAAKGQTVVLSIGNGDLTNYTVEFDYEFSGWYSYSGKFTVFFTPTLKYEVFADNHNGGRWYEFVEKEWKSILDDNGVEKLQGHLRMDRAGNQYTISVDGQLASTFMYGDVRGAPLTLEIEHADTALDNLVLDD